MRTGPGPGWRTPGGGGATSRISELRADWSTSEVKSCPGYYCSLQVLEFCAFVRENNTKDDELQT